MKGKMVKKSVIAVLLIAAVVAAIVYVIPMARNRNRNVAQGKQWLGLLQKHPVFSGKQPAYPVDVAFSYASPADDNLRKLRDTYRLDTVAGSGSETDRIINLMRWVYQLVGHDNLPEIPKERNALNLIRLAKDKHMALNCALKTDILNEVYLAMGFESRRTHLLPHSNEDEESHYITSVYSRTLGKWILMDSDFGAYVTDKKGTILGVAEIRDRLISGAPMVVKSMDPPRGFFVETWSNIRNFIDGTSYLWYLRKNFFKIQCPRDSFFGQPSQPGQVYFELIPDGYRPELLQAPRVTETGRKIIFINDQGLFWQKPADQSL